MKPLDKSEKVFELAKRRGFFWPAYELYGGVSGLLDFGPLGSSLKRKIEEKWRDTFIRKMGFMEIESPIVSPGKVFEASGHVEHFTDKMLECEGCGRKWRADHIISEQTGMAVEALSFEKISEIVSREDLRCPDCKGRLGNLRLFNLMFKTSIGPYAEREDYFRPETAQAMFMNFKRIYQLSRRKLPLAIAQIGRCLRNEISPRQGPIRLREFTIMEFEFFFDPEDPSCPYLKEVENEVLPMLPASEKLRNVKEPINISVKEALERGYILTEWLAYFMVKSRDFALDLGIPLERQCFDEKLPGERAHYSVQTYDHEALCERWGWVELAGLAYRTDFDLKMHMEKSGVDQRITRNGRKFIPHVVEPSYGCDRLLYMTLEYAYSEREGRVVLRLPKDLAPIELVVFPLVSRDGLPEKALEVYKMLTERGFTVIYDDSGYIGRRYARVDEIGVPIAITIDYQTLEDDTVTLRDRDTWAQVRSKILDLPSLLREYLSGTIPFTNLGQ